MSTRTTRRAKRAPAPSAAAPWVEGSPEWLNAQYDNRARVAGSQDLLARWAEASALSRERMTCVLDERYGEAPAATLDVFPARRDGSPVLLFIHGGWWRALDKSDVSFVAPAFVQAGAMVVVPNYTLAPGASVADIALQMTQAVAWTYRNARRYGGDAMQIVVAGHSAGGHLAAMLACCDWTRVADDLPPELVTAALSLSGVFDLEPVSRTPFLQADLKLGQADVARLSPADFPPPPVPVVALVGADESEEHLRQNALLGERWGKAVPVCEALPGLDHFTVVHNLVDARRPVHRHALGLLGL